MLGGNDNGTHAGFLCQGYNFIGIEFYWIELQCCVSIPITEDAGKRLDLFAIAEGHRLAIIHATIDGIKSEVDKHRILVLVPLLIGILCNLCRCTDVEEGSHQESKEFLHDSRLFM